MNNKFYSQEFQDKILNDNVFKDYKNGFFIDIGAHNGVEINNTLFFENNCNWKGINIEPLSDEYEKLLENRPNCININCAISENEGSAKFLSSSIDNGSVGQNMLSGLKDHYDERHYRRLSKEIKKHGGNIKVINVETKRLETICDLHNIKHVNYLSIDVEGAEFSVIKSIVFDKVFIDVIGFENNYPDSSIKIVEYLQEKDFKIIHTGLDILMINKKSEFMKNINNQQ